MQTISLMRQISFMSLVFVFLGTTAVQADYTVVDSGQTTCFGLDGQITCPDEAGLYYGQDAQYDEQAPAYMGTGNGTVVDLNTGLEWQNTADSNGIINFSDKTKVTKRLPPIKKTSWLSFMVLREMWCGV
ncbi:hypothetical protein VU12_06855 [Desulfobulbus sp. US4]|nr:hypothetical protein [Desulfobulbus sp. US4]